MKSLLIVNPASGKGRTAKIQQYLIKTFTEIHNDSEVFISEYPRHAESYIYENGKRFKLVFIAGGDGTTSEVINGMKPEHDFTIGVLGVGSGNDFPRTLGTLGKSPKEVLYMGKADKKDRIDLGKIIIRNADGSELERVFHSTCGVGFDAAVSKISNRKSILRGLPLYLSSVFVALLQYKPLEVSIETEHDRFRGRKLLITIGNTKSSGGGFQLTPRANIADGKLDLMIGEHVSRLKILYLLPRAIFGKHLKSKYVEYRQIQKCSIDFTDRVIIHADGEILTENARQIQVEILPGAISVIK
ncbi:MAG: diacylglycerol kinase family lipid kinase [Ignavibacteria bacterium]|nr:diacylglycerol kinase family lipid kinase [Ignavibacteria bacterium]